MPKTWKEKFNNGRQPEVEVLDKDFVDLKKGATMLISTPAEIDAYLRSLPSGTTQTIKEVRADLAQKHEADGTCPLTTSIFLRIVSEVALEELAADKTIEEVAPFWRAVDPKSPLAKKLSCGPEFITQRREQEKS